MGEKDFLVINGLYKSYGEGESKQEVLKDLNVSVNKGEFCVLLGPSGSGKSALLIEELKSPHGYHFSAMGEGNGYNRLENQPSLC